MWSSVVAVIGCYQYVCLKTTTKEEVSEFNYCFSKITFSPGHENCQERCADSVLCDSDQWYTR